MIWRTTPQRLDPLGGVTAQYFTWSAALVAIAVACVHHLNSVPGVINSVAVGGG